MVILKQSSPARRILYTRPLLLRNRFASLASDAPSPHTDAMMAQDMPNTQLLAEMRTMMTDMRTMMTATEEKVALSVANLSTQVHEVTNEMRDIITQQRSDIDAGRQAHAALAQRVEHIATDISNLRESVTRSSTTRSSGPTADPTYLQKLWNLENKAEQPAIDAISGYAFVKPADGATSSYDTPQKIADTLQYDTSKISQHPKVAGAFRIDTGMTGRAGTLAVTNFVNSRRNLLPRGLYLTREKTTVTLARQKCVKAIRTSLLSTISEHHELKNLKVHEGMNGSNLFLSFSDRKEAFSRSGNSLTYSYPVWEHIPYDEKLNQGMGGFKFDPTNLLNQQHTYIYEKIKAIIPPTERLDINMDGRNTGVREREEERPGGARKMLRTTTTNNNNNGNPGPSRVNQS